MRGLVIIIFIVVKSIIEKMEKAIAQKRILFLNITTTIIKIILRNSIKIIMGDYFKVVVIIVIY